MPFPFQYPYKKASIKLGMWVFVLHASFPEAKFMRHLGNPIKIPWLLLTLVRYVADLSNRPCDTNNLDICFRVYNFMNHKILVDAATAQTVLSYPGPCSWNLQPSLTRDLAEAHEAGSNWIRWEEFLLTQSLQVCHSILWLAYYHLESQIWLGRALVLGCTTE